MDSQNPAFTIGVALLGVGLGAKRMLVALVGLGLIVYGMKPKAVREALSGVSGQVAEALQTEATTTGTQELPSLEDLWDMLGEESPPSAIYY